MPRITCSILGTLIYKRFNEWYEEKIGETLNLEVWTKSYPLFIVPDFDDFDESSFYEPSKAQIFKSYVTNVITGPNQPENGIGLQEFIDEKLPELLNGLTQNSSPKYVYENRSHPLKYPFFMWYHGFYDIANAQIDKSYQYLLGNIETGKNRKRDVERLKKFINNAKILTGKELDDPYGTTFSKVPNKQQQRLKINEELVFNEILRYDIQNIKVYRVFINQNGEILLYFNQGRIGILHPDGASKLEFELPTPEGYDKSLGNIPLGYDHSNKFFYASNVLLFENGETVILEIPQPTKKIKRKPQLELRDLKIIDGQIYLAQQNNLLIYSLAGALLETRQIDDR
ncbi:MAG: hypothetical protein AAFY76_06845, partial [Cyanobacteria bacterium J06649_11]